MVLMTRLTAGMQSRRGHPLLLTLVCSPRVRKNKIRCVINRSRCPGRLLLLLESHLLNSSIKPTRCQRFNSESTIREKVSQRHPRTLQLLVSLPTPTVEHSPPRETWGQRRFGLVHLRRWMSGSQVCCFKNSQDKDDYPE